MCGRFWVEGESENELFGRMLAEAERRRRALTGEGGIAMGEVFPASVAAALARGKNGEVGAYPMLWGFHRPDRKGLIINARSETAFDRPLFRASMLTRRCLIPCSWYFEWAAGEARQSLQIGMEGLPAPKKAKSKIKYAIRPRAPGLVYLAGIYRYEEGERLPVFSILTREPAPEIAFIHDRMPVIFSDRTRGAWLETGADPRETLQKCETGMIYRAA